MADESLHQSGIYCIRNIVSGRIYVGSAVKIYARWKTHRSALGNNKHHSGKLQGSWNKHGKDAFVFEVLELISDKIDLIVREQYWIDTLNAACPRRGFNVHPTAGSPLGKKASAETRARMSALRLGKKLPPFTAEHRAKISAARLGTKASSETKAKMTAFRAGRKLGPQSAEHIAKLSAVRRGRVRSLESRMKQSASSKGRKLSPEHAAKHRLILMARTKAWRDRKSMGQLNLPLTDVGNGEVT
jgi:group I intron endonuclease